MIQPRHKGLFAIAIVCVLMYAFLFSTTLVFADEPAPPATTEETTALSADVSQSEPAAEIEEEEIVEEQTDAPDVETDLPAEPQEEPVTQAEEQDAVEALPAEEEGTLPEQEPANDEPAEAAAPPLDADSETVEEPAPAALQQPAEISVVVVIDEQVEPLATQEAAEALELGDPMWCPGDAKPGDPGCSSSYTSLASLLADLRTQNGGTGVDQDGTIWIEDIYDSSVNDAGVASFNLNGTTLTTWAQHALTFQGGWNGNTISGVSDFSARILILNWNNTVSINDINIDLVTPASTLDGITVTTTGDIALDNVTSQNASRNGVTLNNISGNGKITVTASSFNGNGDNGLVANSNGAISLHNVTASTNGSNGASLNNSNGTGTIVLTGANVFSGNTLSGLRAVSSSDITSSDSLTAHSNGSYGAFLNNSSGTGNVTLSGTNSFNGNTDDGLRVISKGNITLSNITADSNKDGGVDIDNCRLSSGACLGSGNVTITGTNSFTGNTSTGLYVVSTGNITSSNLTANSNGSHGALLNNVNGTGDVALSGINSFNDNYLTGLNIRAGGSISLENVTASNNSQTGNTNVNTGHGVYLNNRNGGGSITISGTNVFNHNFATGLTALADGDITLSNVIAGASIATGNGGNGAFLNNSSGTGDVTLSGMNSFTGNTSTGLYVVSTGNITSRNLTANSNGSYGSLLNNLNGAGDVTLSGTNSFNGNTLNGLHVVSTGNISTNNLTANANGSYGALLNNVKGAGSVTLSGMNIFSGNTVDGLRIVSTGNITSSGSLTANSNGQFGVLLRNDAGTGSISLAGAILVNSSALEGLRIFSNGDVNIATDLTASNNRYGVYVDNSTGAGDVTFSGTNTFSGNNRSGLHVLSNGAVSLSNLTANNNGTGGNFRFGYGVYVDNRTGTSGVTIGGSNNFNGNYSTGLVILTNGAIVANDLTASNNGQTGNSRPDYGYGAYLDNSSGSAGVKLTGASAFNSNYSSGLLVISRNDVTLNSITAGTSLATGNGAHGILVIAGSAVSLTGSNNLIGNRLDGAHITAVGDINIYNPNATLNGQNGVYMETTQGNTSLRCGQLNDNGMYGVDAAQNKKLYLFSMNFSGNGLGSIHTDGGDVNSYPYPNGCGSGASKHPLGGLGIHTVFVGAARGQVTLDCRLYAGTKLILPNGDSALIPCPSGEFAGLQGISKASLPAELPGGWVYGSGFALDLDEALGSRASLSFVIPDGMNADTLAILFWNGSEWVEVKGASKGDRFEAQVDYPGIFVLVSK